MPMPSLDCAWLMVAGAIVTAASPAANLSIAAGFVPAPACTDALLVLCGATEGQPLTCGSCAGKNQQKLEAAMCRAADIDTFCIGRPTVTVPGIGRMVGTAGFGVATFAGIPYAAPPTGQLRWMPPQPPLPMTAGVFNATAPRSECVQGGARPGSDMSEDCLFLNVWSPSVPESPSAAKPSDLLPVMFWIHGGGMSIGTGSEKWSDGTRLAAEQQVVVITVNSRLGPLGFLVSPELKQLYGEG